MENSLQRIKFDLSTFHPFIHPVARVVLMDGISHWRERWRVVVHPEGFR